MVFGYDGRSTGLKLLYCCFLTALNILGWYPWSWFPFNRKVEDRRLTCSRDRSRAYADALFPYGGNGKSSRSLQVNRAQKSSDVDYSG